jgi:hypothetical protein
MIGPLDSLEVESQILSLEIGDQKIERLYWD